MTLTKKSPFALLLFSSALFLAGCSDGQDKGNQAQAGKAPPSAGYITLEPTSVQQTIELPGRVVASQTAEIRPQVDGIIKSLEFREGGPVGKDDVLYTLYDQKFVATYDAAAAAVKKSEATVQDAQATVERDRPLFNAKALSAQEMQSAETTLLQARADLEAAKATLETAKINLDNTRITAPISGTISLSAVSVGALVTANQTDALATVRQLDPVYVDLVDSSANFLRIRDQIEAGRLGLSAGTPPKVTLMLENGKTYPRQGRVSFTERVVSQATGTFAIRSTFDNPDQILLPGMFVRAKIELGELKNVFLVPQRAVTRDSNGEASALFVSDDGTAEQRKLITDGNNGNNWIVTGGMKPGDKIIVDGLQAISPDGKIKPVAAKIDEDGVVSQEKAKSTDKSVSEAAK